MTKDEIKETIEQTGAISVLCYGLTQANRRWLSAQVKRGAYWVWWDYSYPKPKKNWILPPDRGGLWRLAAR
jgi:hypothetical protein